MNAFKKLLTLPSETPRKLTAPSMEETQVACDEENGEEDLIKVWDCGSPLYDSYELASLGHIIERHCMILPSLNGSGVETISPGPSSSSSSSNSYASKRARGSSMMAYFSDFLERNMSKKKTEKERNEKLKKNKSGIYRIFHRMNSGKK